MTAFAASATPPLLSVAGSCSSSGLEAAYLSYGSYLATIARHGLDSHDPPSIGDLLRVGGPACLKPGGLLCVLRSGGSVETGAPRPIRCAVCLEAISWHAKKRFSKHDWWKQLIEKCLTLDPAIRPTARDLLDFLETPHRPSPQE